MLSKASARDIVAQRLRLLTFPSDLQELVSRDTITPSHAELLAKLVDQPSELEDAIAKVAQGKLTTRETANLVAPLVEMQDLRMRALDYLTNEER